MPRRIVFFATPVALRDPWHRSCGLVARRMARPVAVIGSGAGDPAVGVEQRGPRPCKAVDPRASVRSRARARPHWRCNRTSSPAQRQPARSSPRRTGRWTALSCRRCLIAASAPSRASDAGSSGTTGANGRPGRGSRWRSCGASCTRSPSRSIRAGTCPTGPPRSRPWSPPARCSTTAPTRCSRRPPTPRTAVPGPARRRATTRTASRSRRTGGGPRSCGASTGPHTSSAWPTASVTARASTSPRRLASTCSTLPRLGHRPTVGTRRAGAQSVESSTAWRPRR